MTENQGSFYADFNEAEFTPPVQELEVSPTEAGQQAAEKTLAELRSRSFAGRHPELGKMIRCQTCGRRHRTVQELKTHGTDGVKKQSKFVGTVACVQQFATGRYDLRDPKPLLIASQTTAKGVFGAAQFKGKRIKSHPSKIKLQFIELVRSFTPDEYTQEDLKKARAKARRILAEKLGFDFLAPKAGK